MGVAPVRAHVQVVGDSQAGKSFAVNKILHKRFPGASIFVMSKPTPNLDGKLVRSLDNLAQLLVESEHIVWWPVHRLDTKEGQEAADEELSRAIDQLVEWGLAETWQWDHLWFQVVIDEIRRWTKCRGVKRLIREGLSAGGRAVVVGQDPSDIEVGDRKTIAVKIFFRTDDEGVHFLRGKGYPADEMVTWTNKQYCFMAKLPGQGWVRCTKV